MNTLPSPRPQACPLALSLHAQRLPVAITQLSLTRVGDGFCVTRPCRESGCED